MGLGSSPVVRPLAQPPKAVGIMVEGPKALAEGAMETPVRPGERALERQQGLMVSPWRLLNTNSCITELTKS